MRGTNTSQIHFYDEILVFILIIVLFMFHTYQMDWKLIHTVKLVKAQIVFK